MTRQTRAALGARAPGTSLRRVVACGLTLTGSIWSTAAAVHENWWWIILTPLLAIATVWLGIDETLARVQASIDHALRQQGTR